MRIAIITFHRAYNYGAVLQCYALYRTLKKLGHECYVLDYWPKYFYNEYYVHRDFLLTHPPVKTFLNHFRARNIIKDRNQGFENFLKDYLELMPISIVGECVTTLTRVAVPVFFMITGYFYSDTVARHKEKRQIQKILYLVVEANVLFFIWNIALNVLRRDSIITYVQEIFTGKSILKFLALNESPLAGHLWYLGAILYVLVIVLLVDKPNCRKLLYYLTPVLLSADLAFGKYSLLIFHQEFPYILVRNFLCVGIPYFCIGNLIREKRCSEKWNRKILQVLIVVFTITSLAERFVLVSAGLNATRDHYLSTTFLAICLFVYALKSNWCNKGVSVIGRKYSTWLYIIHPIFITVFSIVVGKLGLKSIYRCIAPIVVYCATLVFLIILQKVKMAIKSK